MKALILKASDSVFYENKEIKNLDDLLKINERLIIETDKNTLDLYKRFNNVKYNKDFDILITIYDDYIE